PAMFLDPHLASCRPPQDHPNQRERERRRREDPDVGHECDYFHGFIPFSSVRAGCRTGPDLPGALVSLRPWPMPRDVARILPFGRVSVPIRQVLMPSPPRPLRRRPCTTA